MSISCRSLQIMKWAALLALPLLIAIPADAQFGPPSEFGPPSFPNQYGPPSGPNQPNNPQSVPNNQPPSNPYNNYNSSQPPYEQPELPPNDYVPPELPNVPSTQTTPQLSTPNLNDVYRENGGIDPTEALRRAQELSSPPPRVEFVPVDPFYTPPDDPDVRDQIRRLGPTVPNAPPPTLNGSVAPTVPNAPPPTLNGGVGGGGGTKTVVTQPPRVIRPPVALPNKRPGTGAPAGGEQRLVPDQVVVEVALALTPAQIAALEGRHNLVQLDQFASQLSGTNMLLARITDQRTVAAVIVALENDAQVMAAQPNYLMALQQLASHQSATDGTAQYALAKLRLTQAHQLALGNNVLVGVIDSGIDAAHPELNGAIAETYDLLDGSRAAHNHGTAIAGLIGAHSKLKGSAPAARILAVRAFDASATNQGTTFNVLKGLDWAAVKGARVINMSFAGPSDPAIHRSLDGAYKNGIVLIAAAGNAGPKSPPLYPAADPAVIAIAATDADDKFYVGSNRGRHVSIAAPGVDILVAAPGGRYQLLSGTSLSAAEISGIVALMIERKPDLRPDQVRTILLSTGKAIPEGRGAPPAARLADAYRAIAPGPVLPVAAR